MLGRKERSQLFITGSLRQLVPNDHVLVRVDRVLDVRSSPIACPKDASIKLLSSAIIIPLCSALAAVVSAGPQRTFGSISVIAGARRAFTAKPRHGTDLHAPSGAASPT
jgi:hypothetical protein